MIEAETRRGPGRATWTEAATDGGPEARDHPPRLPPPRRGRLLHRLLRAVADLTRRGGRGRSELARPGSFLLGLRYRACCAFRRIGVKRLGLSGLALARRLSLYAALPALSACLPDRDLSAIYRPCSGRLIARVPAPRRHPAGTRRRRSGAAMRAMHRLCGGLRRIRRDMEPA